MIPAPAKNIRYCFQILALAVIVLATQSPSAQAAERSDLKNFLTTTGFDVALESMAMAAENAPIMLGMDKSEFGESWSAVAQQVFAKTIVHRMALDMLEQTLSDELLTHAADFYASPLGQRLVEVENTSHMRDNEEQSEEGQALLEDYRANEPDRLAILEDLITAVDTGENGVRALQEIQVRFLMAASHAGVLEMEIDEGSLRALLKEGEAELKESIRQSSLASNAATYRDISDDDLAEYVTALRHSDMQQVYELMNAIQHEIMASRFEELAHRMAGLRLGQEL